MSPISNVRGHQCQLAPNKENVAIPVDIAEDSLSSAETQPARFGRQKHTASSNAVESSMCIQQFMNTHEWTWHPRHTCVNSPEANDDLALVEAWMHDPLCTACLQLRVWTSLAGAAVFRSGSACSTWLRLLLPGLAAGRTAGAAAVPHGLLGVLQQLLSHCQCTVCKGCHTST